MIELNLYRFYSIPQKIKRSSIFVLIWGEEDGTQMFEMKLTLIYSVVFINSLNILEHCVSGTVVSTKIRVLSQTQCLLSGNWQSHDTQANAGVERRQR